MSHKPLRLSELKLTQDETPAPDRTRQSRGSRIPCASGSQISSKRSLSSEPKSATKIVKTMMRAPGESNIARSRTMGICQTPLVTPTRSTIGSIKRTKTPTSQKLFKKDSLKPTMDKNWKYNETAALHNYLMENSLLDCIPRGKLNTMSVKQFVSILQHFTELIQTKVRITIANYVEEIPKMLKRYEYSGQVTRSVLIAPNTMHSWPHALALLSWFRVVCQFQQNPSDIAFSRDPEVNRQTNVVNESIFKMYHLWNQEKEEDIKIVQEECINNYIMEDYPEEDEEILVKKRENIAKLEAKINQAKKEYEEVENKLMDFQLKKKVRDELEEKRQNNSDEVQKCKEQIQNVLSQNAELRAEHDQLRVDVQTQRISVEQKSKIEKEISHITRQIDNDKKMSEKLIEANFELDVKIKQKHIIMDKVLLEYNCSLLKLAECLATLKMDFNIDELKYNSESVDAYSMEITRKLEEQLRICKAFQEEHLKSVRHRKGRKEDIIKQIWETENSNTRLEEEINKSQIEYDFMIKQYDIKIQELEDRVKNQRVAINSASKYEDMKVDILNQFREAKMQHEKVLEECKNAASAQAELFNMKLKTDMDQLLSVHEAIVKANSEFGPFLELLQRFNGK